MGLTGQNILAHIQEQYEQIGYKVFAVEPIKPKRVAEIDLVQLWVDAEPPISEKAPATAENVEDTAE